MAPVTLGLTRYRRRNRIVAPAEGLPAEFADTNNMRQFVAGIAIDADDAYVLVSDRGIDRKFVLADYGASPVYFDWGSGNKLHALRIDNQFDKDNIAFTNKGTWTLEGASDATAHP